MRPASCLWLRPLRRRMARIAAARFRWPRCAGGSSCGAGACTISGSSSSRDKWQRRHRLLEVRNWTSRQRSQRTTSRESTGARVVAICGGSCQSGQDPWNQSRFHLLRVICGIGGVEVKGNVEEWPQLRVGKKRKKRQEPRRSRENRGQEALRKKPAGVY